MTTVILLDFDGVILDSIPIKDRAFLRLFSIYSTEVQAKAERFWAQTRGMDRSQRIQQGFFECTSIKPTGPKLASLIDQYKADIDRSLISAPWINGAVEFLSANRNSPIFVVSAAPQIEVHNIVVDRGIDQYINSVFGGPKSKINNIKTIFSSLTQNPKDSIFAGDTLSDFKVANALSIPFLGVVKEGVSSPFPSEVPTVSDLRAISSFLHD